MYNGVYFSFGRLKIKPHDEIFKCLLFLELGMVTHKYSTMDQCLKYLAIISPNPPICSVTFLTRRKTDEITPMNNGYHGGAAII